MVSRGQQSKHFELSPVPRPDPSETTPLNQPLNSLIINQPVNSSGTRMDAETKRVLIKIAIDVVLLGCG